MNETNRVHLLVCVPLPQRTVERLRALDERLVVDIAPSSLQRWLGIVLPADLQRWFLAGEQPPAEDERPVDELVERYLAPAEALITLPRFVDGTLERASRLRWIQFISAGVERFDVQRYPHLLVTNGSGTAAPAIAEYVLSTMLLFARGFPQLIRRQAERHWDRSFEARELSGATCGIVGLGAIGGEVARRARLLGMRVLGIRRSAATEGTTDPEAPADLLLPPSALPRLIAESDYIVLAAPLTPETRHLIGAPELALMRRHAVLVNVGRGGLIDEAALCEALQRDQIAGAALDVFQREPLPDDSPLWHLPNVVITPHASAHTNRHMDRVADLLCDNVQRYLAGKPLRNLVDPSRGY